MRIYWGAGGNPFWPKLLFAGLLNGVSGVDRLVDGAWKPGRIIGMGGLTYNLDVQNNNNRNDFEIRVYDADKNLYPGTFKFTYPLAQCGDQCNSDVLLTYINPGGATTTTATTTTAAKPATTTATTTTGPTTTGAPATTPTTTTTTGAPATTTTTALTTTTTSTASTGTLNKARATYYNDANSQACGVSKALFDV
jgi:hypothetical protein